MVSPSGIVASVPALGLALTSPDTSFPTGTIGFLSDGEGTFDNLFVETTCDGGGVQCASPTSGMTCVFTCAAGYYAYAGDLSRTCTYGVWSGGDLQCEIGACGGMRVCAGSAPVLFF